MPAADLKDGMTPKGFIALQVHGVGDNADATRGPLAQYPDPGD